LSLHALTSPSARAALNFREGFRPLLEHRRFVSVGNTQGKLIVAQLLDFPQAIDDFGAFAGESERADRIACDV
jgi:hypothetical protein